MIIWIDGTFGIGKTTVALKIKERVPDSEIEYLDADFYFGEMLNAMVEFAEKNHCFPAIRGVFPQTNKDFAVYFRKIIEEKAKRIKNLIISMAITETQCKEEIFGYLANRHKNISHIILTASKDNIKNRIESDDNKRDKKTALDKLEENISFLDKNFPNTLRIDTDNKSICDIADEIIKIVKFDK